MGRFDKYGNDTVITVGKEELRLKRVKTEKLQKLMNLVKDEDKMLENLVTFFTDLIVSNYPDETPEGVEAFVQTNVMAIFEEFQIAYGLITKEQLEKGKAKLMNGD